VFLSIAFQACSLYKAVQLGFPIDHYNKVLIDNYVQSKTLESSDNLTTGEEIEHDQAELNLENREVVVKADECIEDDM
jgi:hypothetical protein